MTDEKIKAISIASEAQTIASDKVANLDLMNVPQDLKSRIKANINYALVKAELMECQVQLSIAMNL